MRGSEMRMIHFADKLEVYYNRTRAVWKSSKSRHCGNYVLSAQIAVTGLMRSSSSAEFEGLRRLGDSGDVMGMRDGSILSKPSEVNRRMFMDVF